jgi:hypothetical protein
LSVFSVKSDALLIATPSPPISKAKRMPGSASIRLAERHDLTAYDAAIWACPKGRRLTLATHDEA